MLDNVSNDLCGVDGSLCSWCHDACFNDISRACGDWCKRACQRTKSQSLPRSQLSALSSKWWPWYMKLSFSFSLNLCVSCPWAWHISQPWSLTMPEALQVVCMLYVCIISFISQLNNAFISGSVCNAWPQWCGDRDEQHVANSSNSTTYSRLSEAHDVLLLLKMKVFKRITNALSFLSWPAQRRNTLHITDSP